MSDKQARRQQVNEAWTELMLRLMSDPHDVAGNHLAQLMEKEIRAYTAKLERAEEVARIRMDKDLMHELLGDPVAFVVREAGGELHGPYPTREKANEALKHITFVIEPNPVLGLYQGPLHES